MRGSPSARIVFASYFLGADSAQPAAPVLAQPLFSTALLFGVARHDVNLKSRYSPAVQPQWRHLYTKHLEVISYIPRAAHE